MTRNGKIARLPLGIRNQLGQRLRDGESGKSIVAWLNTLPDVRRTLAVGFEGRAITEQNLSEWKQGGHADWLRHQASLEWAECLREEVAELTATETSVAAGATPTLSDSVSALLTIALGRLLQQMMTRPADSINADERRELLHLSRELARLRHTDQRAALVRIEQDRRAEYLRNMQKREAAEAERERKWNATCDRVNKFTAEQSIIARLQAIAAEADAQPQPAAAPGIRVNPTKSNPIQPPLSPARPQPQQQPPPPSSRSSP